LKSKKDSTSQEHEHIRIDIVNGRGFISLIRFFIDNDASSKRFILDLRRLLNLNLINILLNALLRLELLI
tara:strand:+ start:2381 stop:2590 length:210 start_codon:yes stop_codon:yes gene_type:complete